MIGDNLSSAQGKPGRPKGSRISLEMAFDKFVEYRTEVRKDHKTTETRAKFRDKLGLTDQGFRNYLKDANLPWPLLPDDDSLLVCLIWGHAPYDITWCNQALTDTLQAQRDELIGRGCALPLLRDRASTRLSPEHCELIQRLRTDPEFTDVDNLKTELMRADGAWLPVEVYVRYTGTTHDRFYCVARVTGPAWIVQPRNSEKSNVDPRYIYRLIQQPGPMQLQFTDGQYLLPMPTITMNPNMGTLKFESTLSVRRPPERN